MRQITDIKLKENSKEELLPDFSPDFPYTASRAFLDRYSVPWHWHRAVELFYMEKGYAEYSTPGGKTVFEEGTGGFVNSGVLHMSNPIAGCGDTVQLLHIFEPSFLGGYAGSRIDRLYISPLVNSPRVEILKFTPCDPAGDRILQKLRASFRADAAEPGYELRLREILSDIWLDILSLPEPDCERRTAGDGKMKTMLAFIHEHFGEKITVPMIAACAFVSERECYRLFNRFVHMTPLEYLRDYRLNAARRILAESWDSITNIALSCGFSGASAFGKAFRENFGATPVQYRRFRQDNSKICPSSDIAKEN